MFFINSTAKLKYYVLHVYPIFYLLVFIQDIKDIPLMGLECTPFTCWKFGLIKIGPSWMYMCHAGNEAMC
jgi:hypothetical protein